MPLTITLCLLVVPVLHICRQQLHSSSFDTVCVAVDEEVGWPCSHHRLPKFSRWVGLHERLTVPAAATAETPDTEPPPC